MYELYYIIKEMANLLCMLSQQLSTCCDKQVHPIKVHVDFTAQ